MKRTVGTALNFFFPGAGYLVVSNDKVKKLYSLLWLAGVIGLTYVEQLHTYAGTTDNLQAHDPVAFGVMFGAVFAMNTAFAIDAWREGGESA